MMKKENLQIFIAPVIWSIIFIVFMLIGKIIIGPGHPSGIIIEIIYAFLIAPIIGVFGIIYFLKTFKAHSNTRSYLAFAMNISLILSGILVGLTWYEYLVNELQNNQT